MRRIITLLAILFLWHEGAMAQVTAQFTPSLLFGCPPLVVSFTNQSTGATTYSWEFDNSNTSTLANPTATFSQPGIYNVLLTACNGSQCDTQTQQIREFQPAAPNFTA
ncbi:MAG TPA: PKD domain-containing protein, partial [Chitinophagales bacterium]|nr:PKD domain-containing protein [Chitinophagales bacterium]